MPENVGSDQLAIIRIEGMHCHRCDQTIQKALLQHPGVHEVEVDFRSGQASVLYDDQQVKVKSLTAAISDAGYRVTGFTQRNADPASQPSSQIAARKSPVSWTARTSNAGASTSTASHKASSLVCRWSHCNDTARRSDRR